MRVRVIRVFDNFEYTVKDLKYDIRNSGINSNWRTEEKVVQVFKYKVRNGDVRVLIASLKWY